MVRQKWSTTTMHRVYKQLSLANVHVKLKEKSKMNTTSKDLADFLLQKLLPEIVNSVWLFSCSNRKGAELHTHD